MTLDDFVEDTVTKEEVTPPKPAEDIGELDLRVGEIITCKVHELEPLLYVEEIDVDEENPRMASSQLTKDYSQEDLVGRKVIVLCNGSTIHFRGINRNAMLVCAVMGKKLQLLDPPAESVVGDIVTVPGFERRPYPKVKHPVVVQLLSERTPFAGVTSEIKVNALGHVVYRNQPLELEGKSGYITVESLRECDITYE